MTFCCAVPIKLQLLKYCCDNDHVTIYQKENEIIVLEYNDLILNWNLFKCRLSDKHTHAFRHEQNNYVS